VEGLVNINLVRDSTGTPWAVDLNPRAFGGVVCFRRAGIDLVAGYVEWLHGRAVGPVGPAEPGRRVVVFPTALAEAARLGDARAVVRGLLQEAPAYARWLGWRYVLSESLALAHSVVTGRRAPSAASR
jgi:hypothetical protein